MNQKHVSTKNLFWDFYTVKIIWRGKLVAMIRSSLSIVGCRTFYTFTVYNWGCMWAPVDFWIVRENTSGNILLTMFIPKPTDLRLSWSKPMWSKLEVFHLSSAVERSSILIMEPFCEHLGCVEIKTKFRCFRLCPIKNCSFFRVSTRTIQQYVSRRKDSCLCSSLSGNFVSPSPGPSVLALIRHQTSLFSATETLQITIIGLSNIRTHALVLAPTSPNITRF